MKQAKNNDINTSKVGTQVNTEQRKTAWHTIEIAIRHTKASVSMA